MKSITVELKAWEPATITVVSLATSEIEPTMRSLAAESKPRGPAAA